MISPHTQCAQVEHSSDYRHCSPWSGFLCLSSRGLFRELPCSYRGFRKSWSPGNRWSKECSVNSIAHFFTHTFFFLVKTYITHNSRSNSTVRDFWCVLVAANVASSHKLQAGEGQKPQKVFVRITEQAYWIQVQGLRARASLRSPLTDFFV